MIGEDPNGIPNNLLPYVARVAVGIYPYIKVYGDDYNTKDGTGIRDYIHVVDLARGHIKALDKMKQYISLKQGKFKIYNLGTGIGYSVFVGINQMQKELNWKAEFGLEKMCEDAWRWQIMNPNGYHISD